MTNEEWDRKAEFLLNQQAKFDADMQELKASQAKTEKAINRLQESLASMSTLMFEGFSLLNNKIAESHRKLSEAFTDSHQKLSEALSESHQKLVESQRLTNEKVQTLADLLERHKRDDHGDPLGAEM